MKFSSEPGGAVPAPSAADRYRRRGRARRRDHAPARGRLPRRRRCPRPGGGVPRAVAVRRAHHPGPPLPLLPHAGSGGRRKVPQPPRRRPPVARPSRSAGCLGPVPVGPGHRRGAGSHRGDPRGGPGPVRRERGGGFSRTRIPWRSRRSAPPRYSSDGPAIPARWRCSPSPVPSSASRPPMRRGRGRPPGSATRTRPSPRPSSRPARNSAAIISCGTACACSAGCWPARPATATCRWSRPGAGAAARTAPPSTSTPIEVAALADACTRAAAVTGDTAWLTGVEMSVTWLLGDNDAGIPMLDERTGGCSDALGRTSRSRNQGAESTLAMISVLQQGRRLDAAAAR